MGLMESKFLRQEIVVKPQLVGKTCQVVFSYLRNDGTFTHESIEAPVKNTKQYLQDLTEWFNAEEKAIAAKPLNDLGTQNTYKAQTSICVRIVPKCVCEDSQSLTDDEICAVCACDERARFLEEKTTSMGQWTVVTSTLEEYVRAVKQMRTAYSIPQDDGENMKPLIDPLAQLDTFNKRVELHKELFRQAGVPYHDSSKATRKSKELYDLIEKELEE